MSKSAFTLIEILVVIAIIGILAGLMFPVFSRARENARRTSCLSNAHQIALANFQYKEDYDGIYPPIAYITPQGNRVVWMDLMEPYSKNSQIYRCPSDPLSTRVSYGLNNRAFADVENIAPPTNSPNSITLGTLRYERVAESIMFCESGTKDDFTTPIADSWKVVLPSESLQFPGDSRPSARHMGRVTVAFMDSHVKSLPLDQFYTGQAPSDRYFVP